MTANRYTVQLAALLSFSLVSGFLLYGLKVNPEDVVQIIKAFGMLLLAVFGVSSNTPAETSDGDAP